MKNADEMFKEIGYGNPSQDINIITYQSNERQTEITFIKTTKDEWEYKKVVYLDDSMTYYQEEITQKEHEAICKKLEDLKGEK